MVFYKNMQAKREAAHLLKARVTQPDDLSSNQRIYMVDGVN